jgi:hypothetical protein
MDAKKLPKVTKSFHCESCDYICSKKSLWEKHCGTRKHKVTTNGLHNDPIGHTVNGAKYDCICGKIFTCRQNLRRHKKTCTHAPPGPVVTAEMFLKVLEDNKELRDMLCTQQTQSDRKQMEMMEQMKDQQTQSDKKQNELLGQMKDQQEQMKEQQKQMSELIPKVGNNNTTNNQRFNLQVFLNEDCKDAINWDDFVKSIEVGMKEFDAMTSSSMTEGVTKAICHGIQDLGLHKRPIHCVDMKRRKMCIKEEDAWQHDEQEVGAMLHRATAATKGKYNKILCQWEKDHPNWQQDERETERYLHLLGKMVESTDEKKCTIEIAKNTVIPKDE